MIGLLVSALTILTAPQGTATRYKVVEENGRTWFAAPSGERFWSFGVCCITPGQSFASYDTAKPEYAAFRYYKNGPDWAKDTCARLQDWGFNTIGAWSGHDLLKQSVAPKMHVMPVLHMGSTAGAPWRDMWDPKVMADMESVAKGMIDKVKDDPRVVGYFSDNEMGWWNGALLEWAFKGKGTRKLMVSVLRAHYPNWKAVLKDFEADGADGFDSLLTKGRLYLKPGGNGIVAFHDYIGKLADRYYTLCHDIIKKLDPGALFLGDRYISNYYPEVARAAGKHCDAVSTNLNADWNDGTFARFYLPCLRKLTGKPIIITEYYMAAKENRSGNKNDSSGFPTVATQLDRAKGFLTTTKALLHTPYVLGAHWFQYSDEPKFGRPDGENYNMGLVDIDNKLYEELVQSAKSLNLSTEHMVATSPAKANDVIPYVSTANECTLENWPRTNAFIDPLMPVQRADLYAAWNEKGLLLAVYWYEDRFAEAFYRSAKIPKSENAKLEVKVAGKAQTFDLDDPKAVAYRDEHGTRMTSIVRLDTPLKGTRLTIRLSTRHHAYEERWRFVVVLGPK